MTALPSKRQMEFVFISNGAIDYCVDPVTGVKRDRSWRHTGDVAISPRLSGTSRTMGGVRVGNNTPEVRRAVLDQDAKYSVVEVNPQKSQKWRQPPYLRSKQ